MEANEFVAEVYRRMSLRRSENNVLAIQPDDFENDPQSKTAAFQYKSVLPKEKEAKILDIGFGSGWFLSACTHLGYTNLYGADFGGKEKLDKVCNHTDALKGVFDIENNIADFLSENKEKYDFIHMSHVIEHIPKHSLIFVTDALYKSLNKGGKLFLKTPNMEGLCASSSMYVTLGHEYGFCGSNLESLLNICGFDDVMVHEFPAYAPTVKQKLGLLIRIPFITYNRILHRLFGVNHGDQFGSELIVSGTRMNFPPLFDERYR